MGPIISIFRYMNNKSPNMKMYYLCLYFKNYNKKKLLKHDFYFKISIYRDGVKNNVLKIGPMTEPEKLPVHDSLVGPVVEPPLNR